MSQDHESSNEQPEVVRAPSLRGKDALKTHLTLVAGLALCALAFWFELGRAERGNHLSWVYVFEWPLLGGFAVYMWWKVLHPETMSQSEKSAKQKIAPEFEGMLSAWQEDQRKLEEARRAEEQTSGRGTDARHERTADP